MASSLTKDPASTSGSAKTFFGHPRGLATLFMTEMWERFSFYGMRALLPLYLVSSSGLHMNAATATAIYSIYMAMVYLLAMPGGWFGDRVWGPRKTVTISAAIIMLGHLTLALPGSGTFFAGLALVALGSGLLKANISTMVGHLYNGPEDARRDGGFTVFYMGINLGAFAAPLIIGTIGEKVNWHLGFAIAAAGMALGLAQFLIGTRHLNARSSIVPKPLSAEERRTTLRKGLLWLIAAVVFYGVLVATDVYTLNWALVPITVAGLLIPVAVLVRIKRDRDLSKTEQSKMSGYIWFFVAAAVFWMIYDQGGSTLSLFGESSTTNSLFGVDFPTSWYQSVNPVIIMALAPVVAWIWLALNRRGKEPSTVVKFGSGLFLVGVSFLVFMLPLTMTTDGDKVSPMWLVSIYFLQTVGELCLSPVGLSVTTKMAPAKYGSQMMGVWFLAVTAGDCTTSLLSLAGVDLNKTGMVGLEAALAIVAAFAIWMYRKKVSQLMGDVR
ncbi:oligopeptide:H+ symporter [Streptomyces sp. NBC_00053]|uniref:peptide MFS transporter n=1 Tax=unclassified Streptomyces TaxID=2593676 RepID=UPI000F5BC59D|nr:MULTISPECIES: oligopeptide:H+ symporter [unclassified Streptomyces]WSG51219.1 oligopeptide:H+ symporter [Streptomyces sp. NBC_01732]WSX01887.1 oligopeptide:H+ symporter [Streptomyces sp. NBC_00987]MCX4396219.1 oligopeptide:H+ symporter [Streptomyces sp. NBC_01767]MCX5101139.1 oligopeptide:H+ symporter [Streptomyces sp. NBC_00439]MCX5160661.1 oligopeptide:H+ symporter [Streptomyces sp. NBC_00305]